MSFPNVPQPVMLEFSLPGGQSGTVVLDATVSESHVTAAQVTDHQVEKGSNVADHIRPMPTRVSLEGVVTNTPLATPQSQADGSTGAVQALRVTPQLGFGPSPAQLANLAAKIQALQFTGEFDRVKSVYGLLVDAALGGSLVKLTTTLKTYENMAIINLSVPRSAAAGNAIRFGIEFQQLRFVETREVAALPSKKVAATHRGSKPAKEATPEQTRKTGFAYALLNGVSK